MGDVVFKGFQCLNSACREFMFVRTEDTVGTFNITCPNCGTHMQADGVTKFFDFEVLDVASGNITKRGEFTIRHDDYIEEAQEYKYCILCNTLKPLRFFSTHSARKSGRQGECRLCKLRYNELKNPTRLTDQHREAGQKRRLYSLLAGGSGTIDSRTVYQRFDAKCFNCDRPLVFAIRGEAEYEVDHTLPARFLWPVTTRTATLLCKACNNGKHGKWPSDYYKDPARLRALAHLTGFQYEVLAGPPTLNPTAVQRLRGDVDTFITRWIRYPDEIKRIRRLVWNMEHADIYEFAKKPVPDFLKETLSAE